MSGVSGDRTKIYQQQQQICRGGCEILGRDDGFRIHDELGTQTRVQPLGPGKVSTAAAPELSWRR